MAEKIQIEFVLTKGDTSKAFDDVEKKAAVAGGNSGDAFGKKFSARLSTGAKSAAVSFLKVAGSVAILSKSLEALRASFDNLKGFSRGVAEINSILPANAKLTEEATQKLIEFSSSFGSDQQKQARAFYNIVSAGVKGTSKQLDTLATANVAAVAGLVDIDSAAKVLVSSVNAYAKSGLTAKVASDALFVAVREGQTTFGELSSFLGNVTSVAASAGLKFDELAGFLAFATKNGLATDVAVTGLRQVLVSIIKPSKEAATEAKRLGVQFNTAGLRTKGLSAFLEDLVKKTGGSEVALSKLFGNVRALTPILQVAGGNFGELNRILGETKNSSNATGVAFSEIAKNLDFRLDQVSAEFSALGLNLLRVVNPAITAFANGLRVIGKIANSAFGEASSKPLDVLQARLSANNKEISKMQSNIDSLKGNPLKTIFGNESTSGKNLREARVSLEQLQEKRKSILSERAKLLDRNRAINDARVQSEKSANAEIATSRFDLLSKLKELGVKSTEAIRAEETAKLTALEELRASKLISEFTYQEALFQIKDSAAQQQIELDRKREESAANASNNISAAMLVAAKNSGQTAAQIGKTLNTLAIKGFGNAFKNIGAAIASGKDVNKAFVDSVKATASEAASAFGDYYIKLGVAEFAATGGAKGSATIAGGAGLKLLAGALGASGGGADISSGGGSVESSGSFDDSGVLEQQDVERAEPQTSVQLIVQGDVLDSQETGTKLASTLSEAFNKQGVALTDFRTA